MSTLDKTEKRKFAKALRGVGTAATIRESVVKDLRDSSVLVRWIRCIHPSGFVGSCIYSFIALFCGEYYSQ